LTVWTGEVSYLQLGEEESELVEQFLPKPIF